MVSTHALTFSGPVVTKRYRSWDRGEHRREWLMLRHIHRHAPKLVPRPVSADLEGGFPTVTMSVLPGVPLDGNLSAGQLDALTAAIKQLWAVPHDNLPAVCGWRSPLPFARRLTDGPRPAGRSAAAAYDAAVAWWDGPDPALLQTPPPVTVLGHGDANLANYLWDGREIRIVDFEDATIADPATELANLVSTCPPGTSTAKGSALVSRSTRPGCGPAAGYGPCSGCGSYCPAAPLSRATHRARPRRRPDGCSIFFAPPNGSTTTSVRALSTRPQAQSRTTEPRARHDVRSWVTGKTKMAIPAPRMAGRSGNQDRVRTRLDASGG